MTEWRELLIAAGESKFDEPVPTKSERRWSELIADVNAHNAYHGGQILLLRKLQGSWNPEKGVS
jgi:predicted secreted Zn-dependent protease